MKRAAWLSVAACALATACDTSQSGGEGAVHWRGPGQNGAFPSTALPASWSPEGENLLWSAEAGSRNAPLVMNGKVFVQHLSRLKQSRIKAKMQKRDRQVA